MAPTVETTFIEAAFRLSRISASHWSEFMSSFDAYVQRQVEEAIKAPVDEALTAHGRAQAYMAVRDTFRNIDAAFLKLHPR